MLSMSNSRHCLILHIKLFYVADSVFWCVHCPTQELITIKKVTLIWGLQIVYQLHLTIYSFRARALKKEENDRYLSSILAMQVVFFLKWACSLNFISTDYKVTTNAIFLWTRSLYKILYFAVNILKKTEILVKFSFSYEVMVKCFLQKNTTPSWS